MKLHIAKEGDTLQSLSEKYAVDLERIVGANPNIDGARVEPGAKVKIPTGPVAMQAPPPEAQLAAAEAPPKKEMPEVPSFVSPWSHPELEHEAPSMYKTEPQQANLSPLNVKWTGMMEEAVHPFAQIPVPTYPAGAYAPPMTPFAETGGADLGPPYGSYYGSGTMPMMPYGLGMNPYTGYPGYPGYPGAHDCGCGGTSAERPYLPYALPLVTSARAGYTDQASANLASLPEASGSLGADTAKNTTEKVKETSLKNNTKASVSSRKATLKAFLKRSKSKKKYARYGSKPWVRD